jgi:membrane protein implicated in regulation of membrane protease activity
MELWLIWVIAGFVLVIAEMVTGTFYLLVIGIGAFVGALVAWLGGNELVQAVVSGGVAVAGTIAVHHWHHRNRLDKPGEGNFLDRGQPVVLEGWANETARIARVKYRGASWDARLARADERPAPGTTLYIEGQEGNTLVVATAPPHLSLDNQ